MSAVWHREERLHLQLFALKMTTACKRISMSITIYRITRTTFQQQMEKKVHMKFRWFASISKSSHYLWTSASCFLEIMRQRHLLSRKNKLCLLHLWHEVINLWSWDNNIKKIIASTAMDCFCTVVLQLPFLHTMGFMWNRFISRFYDVPTSGGIQF